MSLGISIYFGLDNTREENIELIKKAHSLGYERIFTSLHIPEANYEVLKSEVGEFLEEAKKLNMDVISDISPNTFKFLGLDNMDLKGLKDMGISTIRIDFGYSDEEIAFMSKNSYGIKIQMNASTLTEDLLDNLRKYNTDFSNIDALHNFYPRRGTGISVECMLKMNHLLRDNGLKNCAFVQSNNRKRGPIKEGLPTLEDHRDLDISIAATELYALGCNDIFIGDSLPSDYELNLLAHVNENTPEENKKICCFYNYEKETIKKEKNNIISQNDDLIEVQNYNLNEEEEIVLRIDILTKDKTSLRLLKETYTSRIDEARDAIRAQESRVLLDGEKIEEEFSSERKFGHITLDNIGYARYMGELEIILRDCPKDSRINIVAKVKKDDISLLNKITGGKKFRFEF